MKFSRALVVVLAVLTLVLVGIRAYAEFSLDPISPTVPPLAPYLAGAPCGLAAPFSPAGDLMALVPPLITIPSGPAGCGLGLGAPGNVNAFSSGLGPPAGFPLPAGGVGFAFSVDYFSTGDFPGAVCGVPPVAGPFPPDVGTEAGDLTIGGTSDAGADLYATYAGPGAPLPAAAPLPGTMPHTQLADGNGLAAPPFFFAPPGALGLVEPGPGADDIDAADFAPAGAIDFVGPDGLTDVNVYFSLDLVTAGPAAGDTRTYDPAPDTDPDRDADPRGADGHLHLRAPTRRPDADTRQRQGGQQVSAHHRQGSVKVRQGEDEGARQMSQLDAEG